MRSRPSVTSVCGLVTIRPFTLTVPPNTSSSAFRRDATPATASALPSRWAPPPAAAGPPPPDRISERIRMLQAEMEALYRMQASQPAGHDPAFPGYR